MKHSLIIFTQPQAYLLRRLAKTPTVIMGTIIKRTSTTVIARYFWDKSRVCRGTWESHWHHLSLAPDPSLHLMYKHNKHIYMIGPAACRGFYSFVSGYQIRVMRAISCARFFCLFSFFLFFPGFFVKYTDKICACRPCRGNILRVQLISLKGK